jgi:hypothetical protein
MLSLPYVRYLFFFIYSNYIVPYVLLSTTIIFKARDIHGKVIAHESRDAYRGFDLNILWNWFLEIAPFIYIKESEV